MQEKEKSITLGDIFHVLWKNIILLAVIACIITYKEGELHELHKTRAAFEHYLEAHESLKEVLGPGIEAAKNLVDQLEEDDKI